jgi:hypothetical protein
MGVGRKARGVQPAMATSRARCSTVVTIVAAAGLGVSRQVQTDLAFIGGRDVLRRLLGHQGVTRSRHGAAWPGTAEGGGDMRAAGRPMAQGGAPASV